MKTITNVTLYACDHCGKRFHTKRAHDYHEAHKCKKNPNNQHMCFGFGGYNDCKHLDKNDGVVVFNDGEIECSHKTFTCKISGKDMFTYRLSDRRRASTHINGIRMPIECEFYEKRELI